MSEKSEISPAGTAEEVRADEKELPTERSRERRREDDRYVPVIVKRTDEVRRHPDDALEKAIEEGREQLERPLLSLTLSSIAAGLILGFSAMAVAVVTVAVQSSDSPLLMRLIVATVYPLGFVMCVMSGAQLFTEHTATAVYPVLDRKESPGRLLRLWGIVIAGNLIGTAISAGLLTLVDDIVGARQGYIAIGEHLVKQRVVALFISALLAGWLMALGAWLVVSTPPDMSQIMSIYIVTFLIGLGGFHHSIAGSAEMFAALYMGNQFTMVQAAQFIGLALIGNLAGGSLFVAVLNYAHIRQTQETPDD